jgi:hypothetical protein
VKGFPEERVRAIARKFDAGWERGSAPYEYWAMYLEAAYVEGAKLGWSLRTPELKSKKSKVKKKVAKKKVE